MARRTVAAIALAWLVSIAIDFVIFGGVFAGVLEGADHPAVLAPEQLFVRIPAGYASFLLEVVFLRWLVQTSRRPGTTGGLVTGLLAGLVFATAVALGLWSFSTVPAIALALWWLTLLLQFTASGAVLGAADTPQWPRVRTRALWAVAALAVAGVVLQNLG
jgi:ABC-type multidrug transport system permease subunit